MQDFVTFNSYDYQNYTYGKTYRVLDFCPSRNMYKLVEDDNGQCGWCPAHLFR